MPSTRRMPAARRWTAAAGVTVSGAIILGAGGWCWLEPATALVIAVIVGYHALKLVRKITSPACLPVTRARCSAPLRRAIRSADA